MFYDYCHHDNLYSSSFSTLRDSIHTTLQTRKSRLPALTLLSSASPPWPGSTNSASPVLCCVLTQRVLPFSRVTTGREQSTAFAFPWTSEPPLKVLKVFIYNPTVCLSPDPKKLEVCLLYF